MEFRILCSGNVSCSTACWGMPWVNRRFALRVRPACSGKGCRLGTESGAGPAGVRAPGNLEGSSQLCRPLPPQGLRLACDGSSAGRDLKRTRQQRLLRLFVVILTARTCGSRGPLVQKHCRHRQVAAGTAEGKSGAEGPLACCADDSGAPGSVLMKSELNKYLPFCSPFSRLPDIIQKTHPVVSLRFSRSSAQIFKFF